MTANAKTFDLTFRGEIQPRRDSRRVKSRLAEYLHIDDQAMLEELFSGQTVYLRRDLDRKSAAEHFRQLSQLGCLAALLIPYGVERVEDLPRAKVDDLLADIRSCEPPEPAAPKAAPRGIEPTDAALRQRITRILDCLHEHEMAETDLIQRLEYEMIGAGD